jgi:hypothetical protein
MLTLNVHDQIFGQGDYVSQSPTISISVEDESGLDMVNGPISLFLNDNPVDSMDVSLFQDPGTDALFSATYRPSLEAGEYVLRAEASDIAGNRGEAMLNFKVSSGFRLLSIANHPNPFPDETIIAYTLTGEAEETKIQIYTASGRLIRTMTFTNEMNYVEHVWDGRDDHSDEVANGVYYMRFQAKRGNDRIERIEKMAKLK